jgi:hypothetical protein
MQRVPSVPSVPSELQIQPDVTAGDWDLIEPAQMLLALKARQAPVRTGFEFNAERMLNTLPREALVCTLACTR